MAEQLWKRRAVRKLKLTKEQEVFCKFRSILNKLTFQNFDKLADQTLQLKVNTEERLKGVIDKIVTKVELMILYWFWNIYSSHSHWKREK